MLPIIAHGVEGAGELGCVSPTQKAALFVKDIVIHGSISEDWVRDVLTRSSTAYVVVEYSE